MGLFEVILAPKAMAQLDSYIAYIQYTLLNEQAAREVWQDALDTLEQLERVADSLRECSHPRLKEQGYRAIHFLRHRYVMFYRVENRRVYVDAIYHQLQDYENRFINE